jgi:hypothetical protein
VVRVLQFNLASSFEHCRGGVRDLILWLLVRVIVVRPL